MKTLFWSLLLSVIMAVSTVAFLYMTEPGLWVVYHFGRMWIPGSLECKSLKGSLSSAIEINDLDYHHSESHLTAKRLILTWKATALLNQRVALPHFSMTEATFNSSPISAPVNIDSLELKTDFSFNKIDFNFFLEKITGHYQHMPIKGYGEILYQNNQLKWNETRLQIGKNEFYLKSLDNAPPNTLNWIINIPDLNQLSFKTSGTLHLKPEETILEIEPGTLRLPLPDKTFHTLHYQGARLIGKTKDKALSFNLFFKESKKNYLRANINVSPKHHLSGNFESEMKDLSLIYVLLPQVSRFKGFASIQGYLDGTVSKPEIILKAEIPNAIFSLPKPHITFKNFNFKLAGHLPGRLNVNASTIIHNETVTLTGFMEVFKNGFANGFDLEGQNVRVYNTPDYQVIASPSLHLEFVEDALLVTGTIEIPEADVRLKEELNQVGTSHDVVFVNARSQKLPSHHFQIIPDVQLIIERNFHFKGYNLDANIGGKLAISKRPDGPYTGTGRLTIKEGKYKLPGPGTFNKIDHGRLLFPPGTLLYDPLLDIRVAKSSATGFTTQNEVGISVQGTLQKPVFDLYSSDHLQKGEILSRLGYGGSEGGGQAQLLSILANSNPLIESLQSHLGCEEFGIQKRDTYTRLSTPGGAEGSDSALVVGKMIGKRVYVQFIQGLLEPSSLIRLRYLLSPYFAISVENGTEGLGGDLSFSVEKD